MNTTRAAAASRSPDRTGTAAAPLRGLSTIALLLACAGCKDPAAPAVSGGPKTAAAGSTPTARASAPAIPTPASGQDASEPAAPEPAAGAPKRWSFDEARPGRLPGSWLPAVGTWRVEATAEANSRVLVQTAESASPTFNLALLETESHADLELGVRLRARAGRIDQGGGLVWRARSPNDYYVARYNPLEDNYRVYTVENGRRSQLASARVALDHQAWHELRIRMRGDHIECFLDGEKHLDVRDSTFPEAGRVGLWTKADAQTEFDDLVLTTTGDAEP